jgi:hypothetical protein
VDGDALLTVGGQDWIIDGIAGQVRDGESVDPQFALVIDAERRRRQPTERTRLIGRVGSSGWAAPTGQAGRTGLRCAILD